MGIEVLHQNEGHPGIGRRIGQERLERCEATGRGADADDKAAAEDIAGSRLGRVHRFNPFDSIFVMLATRCSGTMQSLHHSS